MKAWKERFVLGITGMMGSGKSTAARFLEEAGAFRISADHIAKFYTSAESPIKEELVTLLGQGVLDLQGVPDRKAIAKIVFSDAKKLQALNELIHPLVRKQTRELLTSQKQGTFIAWEVPLLFESGAHLECDATLSVVTEEHLAEKRVWQRDNLDAAAYQARIAKQMPIKKKIELSDFIIENNTSPESLKQQCMGIYNKIMQYRG
ncbi:MAG: dephospho-CoA kinase [Spirochaetota bacterium]